MSLSLNPMPLRSFRSSFVTMESLTRIPQQVCGERKSPVEAGLEANRQLDLTDRLLATDVATCLPGDLLVKMDIASMANSLETRSPLLDQEVVEFSARLPSNFKLRGLTT